MKVVRQRTPGLRHIYNKFLKKKPGFQGKVTLKFTIAPGGEIISISIASSTTGYGEFDGEVKNAVSRWKFSKVKSGNTTVTIHLLRIIFRKKLEKGPDLIVRFFFYSSNGGWLLLGTFVQKKTNLFIFLLRF